MTPAALGPWPHAFDAEACYIGPVGVCGVEVRRVGIESNVGRNICLLGKAAKDAGRLLLANIDADFDQAQRQLAGVVVLGEHHRIKIGHGHRISMLRFYEALHRRYPVPGTIAAVANRMHFGAHHWLRIGTAANARWTKRAMSRLWTIRF